MMQEVVDPVWACAAVLLFACGWECMPMSDALLKRKDRKYAEWLDERCASYSRWTAVNGREPNRKAGGDEGALGEFAYGMLAQARDGKLTEEEAEKLAAAGIEVSAGTALAPAARYEYSAPSARWQRAVLAALFAALGWAVLTLSGLHNSSAGIAGLLLATTFTTGAVLSACDVRARILPWEACAVQAAGALAANMLLWGPRAVAGALIASVALAAVIGLCSVLFRRVLLREGAGTGDLYAAPAAMLCAGCGAALPLTLSSGIIVGLIAYVIASAAIAAVMLGRKKTDLHGSVPMGPALQCMAVAGAVAALL